MNDPATTPYHILTDWSAVEIGQNIHIIGEEAAILDGYISGPVEAIRGGHPDFDGVLVFCIGDEKLRLIGEQAPVMTNQSESILRHVLSAWALSPRAVQDVKIVYGRSESAAA